MSANLPSKTPSQKTVLVIGGGFAGLNATKILAKDPNIQTILIDQKNHHLFQPLLYQVATAGLNPSDIAVPIRSEFSENKNVQVYLGKVESINLAEKYLEVKDTKFNFDYLILACGSSHSYFSHPEWEEFAPGLKTLEQALEIRRRILSAFEEAENEPDPVKQKALLNIVIVGGGPTGVELAGAIAEISRTVLVKDFRKIDPASACILLVEGSSRVLSSFDEKLSDYALRDLKKLGVEVKLSTYVTQVTQDGVTIGDQFIPSKTIFWAAGVQARKIKTIPSIELDRSGRIKVEKDFSIPSFPFAFAVGDMANYTLTDNHSLPGLAPVATQSGVYAAQNIIKKVNDKPIKEFRYIDRGQMATIGKNKAIAQSGIFKFHGLLAWLMWLFIHIFYLVGFKNRISVFFEWTWSYFLGKRGARLITGKEWRINAGTKACPEFIERASLPVDTGKNANI